jgi:hypothetical protein
VTGLSIWTEEFNVDVGDLLSITFDMNHNQTDSNSRLLLQIGGLWYISELFYSATGAWETFEFDLTSGLAFGTDPLLMQGDLGAMCAQPGDTCGPFLPASFNVTLPANGTVDAFGVFVDGTSANHRFDNYTINAAVPEPATLALLISGIAGVSYQRRRRSKPAR